MTIKNKALIIFMSIFMMQQTCSGMSYIRNWYNSLTTKTTTVNAEEKSPSWIRGFLTKCYKVGIMPTISAAFGVYNFKTITGLDKDKLNNYDASAIEQAMDRIKTLARYGNACSTLNNFDDDLQT